MQIIEEELIIKHLDFNSLINRLQETFAESAIAAPMRHHHDYSNPGKERESTLLLMPAWLPGKALGVKMVNVSPYNGEVGLPSINGIYILSDANNGQVDLILDAKAITVRRTAAASALASKFLSREDSTSLLMVGTGALAPHLVEAHCTVRPSIQKILVWGRDINKTRQLVNDLKQKMPNHEIHTVEDLDSSISKADIISCATLSKEPLIKGLLLTKGQHIDLVGAYRPDMREADNELIIKSDIYVDTYEGALKETGDLVIPLKKRLITESDVKAELSELCASSKKGRISDEQITCFKSVGHAMEDLAAALMVKEKISNNHRNYDIEK